jgi:hypothetical protein
MSRIDITSITGTSPFDVYVSDYYGNNNTFIGTIGTNVPPIEYFYLPAIFNYAPGIMLIIKDANNCELSKFLVCRTGCAFEIVINDNVCTINLSILS